ncbi:MAG: UbiA family prenyltransferase [Saprospiraceae bacterium]|nr:UbiA family prenyltransferase [Saprospiraceae bacterium]
MPLKILSRFIRLPNLLITVLSLLLIFLILIFPRIENLGSISIFLLIAIILGVVSIMAAGNIYNDIYDQVSDKINRSNQIVIGVYISETKAYRWSYLLNAFALVIASGISLFLWSITPLVIFTGAIFLLIYYSKKAKGVLILGNIIISLLCALVFYIVPICYSPYLGGPWYRKPDLLLVIILLSSLAFFTTMIRELIKDLQDKTGDEKASILTIANTWTLVKVKTFGYFLFIFLLLQLLWAAFYFFYHREELRGIYFVGLSLSLCLLVLKFAQANSTSQFATLSGWMKLYILQGILLLLFWI